MPASSTQAYGQPFADTIGGHRINVVDWKGPTAYVGGIAEKVDPSAFFGGYGAPELMYLVGGISISGTYGCEAQPVGAGVTTWGLRYYTVSTGAELGAGPTDLSGETFKIWGYGV
jgi:hypothetical protein